jgi:transglutaminase-like putative cysteine protease
MKFLNVKLPHEVEREEFLGNFDGAINIIERWLLKDLPEEQRTRLIYEKERIRRLLQDYPHNEETAISKAKEEIKDFSEDEFYYLLDRGILDYIMLNGKRMYEERFIPNIAFALTKYNERIRKDFRSEKSRNFLNNRLQEILQGSPPKEYRVRAKISLFPPGDINNKKLRVWLPFPKDEFQIKYTRLVSANPGDYFISPSDSPQRTIYFEGKNNDNYSVEFEYIVKEWMNRIVPSSIGKVDISDFLSEEPPHIIFTSYLKRLTEKIVKREKNPYLMAKRIYDWVTLNIRYSYVRPYMLYDNIPEFVAGNLRGDCGFQALLFITLLRIAGVPARWQSGWYITPFYVSPHDWTLFYVHPYGWLPADLSFGGARRDSHEFREFYFGNLDAFRMVANSDFMKGLMPLKTFWRTDPYDNQIGEVETGTENIHNFTHEIESLKFEEI